MWVLHYSRAVNVRAFACHDQTLVYCQAPLQCLPVEPLPVDRCWGFPSTQQTEGSVKYSKGLTIPQY